MIENIRIVLLGTTHSGNIGATARAMKTMGLRSLYLVAPKAEPCNEEARRRAAGADDVLENAKVVPELLQALTGCGFVVGSSARPRSIEWPALSPAAAARELVAVSATTPVAVLFGPERNGLDNNEVEFCNALVTIPANPEYSSLNLASAVQIMSYEIFGQLKENPTTITQDQPLADPVQLRQLYQHLATTLDELAFIKSGSSTKLLRKFVRLLHRARMREDEVDMLRGVLTAIRAVARSSKTDNS